VLELIAFLEERYHVEIDTTKYHVLDFDTIRKVGAIIDDETAKGGDRDSR
jgi:acyl carrier protein